MKKGQPLISAMNLALLTLQTAKRDNTLALQAVQALVSDFNRTLATAQDLYATDFADVDHLPENFGSMDMDEAEYQKGIRTRLDLLKS